MEAKIQTGGNSQGLSELRQVLNQAPNPLREERNLLVLRSIDELGRRQQETYEQSLGDFRAMVGRGIISRLLHRAPKDPSGVIPLKALEEGVDALGIKEINSRIRELADVGIVRVAFRFDDYMTTAWMAGVSITALGKELMGQTTQPERLPLDSSWRNPFGE
jgi:hypothetical protein